MTRLDQLSRRALQAKFREISHGRIAKHARESIRKRRARHANLFRKSFACPAMLHAAVQEPKRLRQFRIACAFAPASALLW
jgi:hypothetical protein